MDCLSLSADYTCWSVVVEGKLPLFRSDLTSVPDNLLESLDGWNSEYSRIVPMPMDTRREPEIVKLIESLDTRGQTLAELLGEALGRPVGYYSEGLLRQLDSCRS